ncbi:MAG: hypothetical protein ACK6DB_17115 [Planctomycetota bacterium]
MNSDEQSDAPKSPVGCEFESLFFGGDWVIAVVIPFVAPAGQALTGVQGNCGNFFDRMFFLQ